MKESILNEITAEVDAMSKEEVAEAAAKILERRRKAGLSLDDEKSDEAPDADFVLAHSSYGFRGEPPFMSAFRGTFRELLEDLTGVTEENREELEAEEMSLADLIKIFDEANGDGQPYVMVWSVAEGKKVLG